VAKLSIALTLPGEASLGTFEAGALSALLVGLQRINKSEPDAVAVDVMAGASSGSLTAVLAAAALLSGADPIGPLRQAWVSEPSLAALRGNELRAPLSLDRAREVAHRLLASMLLGGAASECQRGRAQTETVTLEFALTCLRGFNYKIPQDGGEITATSYIDWAQHEFGRAHLTGLTKEWSTAVDSAIASASLPFAFPPALLDRSLQREDYEAHGVENLPKETESEAANRLPITLWYSDGGLVDREPLGRCLRLVRGRDQSDCNARVVLVIRPYPEDAPGREDDAWTGFADPPRWRATLARALRVLVTHSLYEDLRKLESRNRRLVLTESLVTELEPLLKSVKVSELSEAVERIRVQAGWSGDKREPLAADVPGLLRQALHAATGLEGKRTVKVDIVAAGGKSKLSGSTDGFVAERLRATDFLVGYEAMLGWMDDGLQRHGVPGDLVEAAKTEARGRAATIPGWIGEIPVRRRPPLRVSAQLAKVGFRAARAGVTNPRASDVQRTDRA
jgi:predicted acylesterase/phospholipase RssA